MPRPSSTSSAPKKRTVKKKSSRSAGGRKKTTRKKTRASKKKRAGTRKLHLISDFTGNLANHIVTSVVGQFPGASVDKVFHIHVDDEAKLADVLESIRAKSDLVMHSVISARLKDMITAHCDRKGIGCLDLTGPTSEFLSQHLRRAPSSDPSELHKVDESYFKRIDAMEFTRQHDDSRRLESIDQADVVLVGISRVSKSPTATFMSSMGFRTANVSIVPSFGLPEELKLCKGRTVALSMRPRDLYEIRQRRMEINGFAARLAERSELAIPYMEPREVAREVRDAESLYRKSGIPIIDVTGMTIEETTAHVFELLELVPQ